MSRHQWVCRLIERTVDNPKVIAAAVALITGYNVLVYVPQGKVSVQVHRLFGVRYDLVDGPGLYTYTPFLMKPVYFDVQPTPLLGTSHVTTNDGKTLRLTIKVTYHPMLHRIVPLYQSLGAEYTTKLFPYALHKTVSALGAEHTLGSLQSLQQSGALGQMLLEGMDAETSKSFVKIDGIELLGLEVETHTTVVS